MVGAREALSFNTDHPFHISDAALRLFVSSYRTDTGGLLKADVKKNLKDQNAAPDWFQLDDGHFPAEGAAHAASGELISVDLLERWFQIQLKMDLMLEGDCPKRIVRFCPTTWKVNSLPREEELFGRE
jgi:hypothetical protein